MLCSYEYMQTNADTNTNFKQHCKTATNLFIYYRYIVHIVHVVQKVKK